jgi:hypothetical protein
MLKYVFFGSQLRIWMKGKKQFQVSQDYVPKSLTQPLAQAISSESKNPC